MGDLREPNGVAAEERPVPSPSSSSSSLIGLKRWAEAEKAAQNIICKVQPTTVSEERRRQVIDYVQRLIRGSLGCEVFPYGSVPLKTYLPDGDIDLTAFGGASVEDALANDMVSVLEGEDRNGLGEFVVKDVQLIRAEVKLVKCIVQNIVVDISFNQIGGLCTLCFLEQVDRLIGKDHLFKRSILLIKAWCYYESRILGAHHGLISTYALETLVLYIFHLFHSTLDGPLQVLYKFLDYFSKFDWENYCISLIGPVRISSLPEIVADIPENGGGDLLLSSDFLRYCIDIFSVPSRSADIGSRTFLQKHLNIVDPLKENNNLGRSVSKGNFYRIRSAFNYGARKLGRILLLSEDDIADELCNFFSNTLERHGHGQRPDVQDPNPLSNCSRFGPAFSTLENESSQAGKLSGETKTDNLPARPGDCRKDPHESSHDSVGGNRASEIGAKGCIVNGEQEFSEELYHPIMSSETNGPMTGNVWGHHHREDTEDTISCRIQSLIISNEAPKISDSNVEHVSSRGTPYHAPHHYFTNSLICNGEINSDSSQLGECKENSLSKLSVSQGCDDGRGNSGYFPDGNILVVKDEVMAARSRDALALSSTRLSEDTRCINERTSNSGSYEYNDSLSDLVGDYDSHFNCLQYGRWCYEYGSCAPVFPISLPPPHFQMKISWDPIQHLSQFKRNGYSHANANGVFPSPALYAMNPLVMPGVTFGLEDIPKPRGTGTYFPNMSRPPQGYRPSAAKGRNQPPSRSPRNNGRTTTFRETSNHDRSSHETPQSELPLDQSGMKHGNSDAQQSFSPRGKDHPKVNGSVVRSEGFVEFGSVGQVPVGAHLLDRSRQQRIAPLSPQNSSPVSPTQGMQRSRPVFSRDYDRVSAKSSYRLRNEEDFPPLSV